MSKSPLLNSSILTKRIAINRSKLLLGMVTEEKVFNWIKDVLNTYEALGLTLPSNATDLEKELAQLLNKKVTKRGSLKFIIDDFYTKKRKNPHAHLDRGGSRKKGKTKFPNRFTKDARY